MQSSRNKKTVFFQHQRLPLAHNRAEFSSIIFQDFSHLREIKYDIFTLYHCSLLQFSFSLLTICPIPRITPTVQRALITTAKIKTYLSRQCCGIDGDDKTSLMVGLGWRVRHRSWLPWDSRSRAPRPLNSFWLTASIPFLSNCPPVTWSSHSCCILYCELNNWACVLILHWPSRTQAPLKGWHPRLARQRTQFWQMPPSSQSSQGRPLQSTLIPSSFLSSAFTACS